MANPVKFFGVERERWGGNGLHRFLVALYLSTNVIISFSMSRLFPFLYAFLHGSANSISRANFFHQPIGFPEEKGHTAPKSSLWPDWLLSLPSIL